MSVIKMITGALLVGGSLGVGTAASAGDFAIQPSPPPPRPTVVIDTIAVAQPVLESTTCEGAVQCRLLGNLCEGVGGTFTDWNSTTRGHGGHPHGICTWPWE